MVKIKSIAVLGAGNSGFTIAAHLGLLGYNVRIYEPKKFEENINVIKDIKEIKLTGAIEGVGKIEIATSDIKEAITGADLIFVAVPGFAHDFMIDEMIPYLEKGQYIIFLPGNYATLKMYKKLLDADKEDLVIIGETSSMLYACRKASPDTAYIRAVKNTLPLAAMPSNKTEELVSVSKTIFDSFRPSTNVLDISLSNPNCMVHVPTSILNAGWIEKTKGDFDFYWDGISTYVCSVIEKADKERVNVGKKLGIDLISLEKAFDVFYNLKAENLHKLLTTSEIHGNSGSPPNMRHRYVHEDTPYGLVPIASIAKMIGVETPMINSLIEIASAMNKIDYMKEGINIEKLHIDQLSIEQIITYVEKGTISNCCV